MIDAANRHPRILFALLASVLLTAAAAACCGAASVLLPHYAWLGMAQLPSPTAMVAALGKTGATAIAAVIGVGTMLSCKAKEGRLYPAIPFAVFGGGMLFFLAALFSLALPLFISH